MRKITKLLTLAVAGLLLSAGTGCVVYSGHGCYRPYHGGMYVDSGYGYHGWCGGYHGWHGWHH